MINEVFNDVNIIKIGHSITNDISTLNVSLGLKIEKNQSFIDIENFFEKISL